MYNYGLGIEHEMRMRFTNEIDIKEIIKESDKKNIDLSKYSKYLFIKTTFITDYFYKMEEDILLNFDKSMATNQEERDFAALNILKREVIDLAIKKKKYPFNDKKFYVFISQKSSKKQLQINREKQELFKLYINTYLKYHYPLMYYKIECGINKFKKTLHNLPKFPSTKEDFINFKKIMRQFYNGQIYRDYIVNLKKIVIQCNYILINKYSNVITISYYSYSDKPFIQYKSIKNMILQNINKEINIRNNQYNLTNLEYKTLYFLNKHKEPHDDYSSHTSAIEFITIKYKNRKYLDSLNELISYQNLFFKIINSCSLFKEYINKYGPIVPHHTGCVGPIIELDGENINSYRFIKEDYTGSYHVWTTPFYSEKTSPESFINILITLSNKLQLLEPLFAAHFTSPSVFAIGNNLYHSRMSLRGELNVYGGYGGSDIMLLKGHPYSSIENYYMGDRLNKEISIYDTVKLYDPITNKLIKDYNILDTRMATNFLFSDTSAVQYRKYNLNLPNKDKKKSVQTYFQIVFSKYNLKFDNTINIGADIRTRPLNNLFYPKIKKNYSPVIIWSDGKFYKKYVKEIKVKDKIVKKIVENPKYDMVAYKRLLSKERVGIEFRIFDHFPTPYMRQFLSILAPLVYQSSFETREITNDDIYTKQQFWHNEMANVIINGFEYKISNEYLQILEREFNIKIENARETEDVLYSIYNKLDHKYYNKELYNNIKIPMNREDFININKLSWFDTFKTYLQNNPKLYDKIMRIKESRILTYSDIDRIFGKHFKQDIHRIKYYFDTLIGPSPHQYP